jgi:hypothetical protein
MRDLAPAGDDDLGANDEVMIAHPDATQATVPLFVDGFEGL